MTFSSLLVLSLGLSADAFAASVGRGAATTPPHLFAAMRSASVFGIIEMLTPLIGWLLGAAFVGRVEAIDHWIAFVLLFAVGGHMAWHAFTHDPETEADGIQPGGSFLGLVATAIGTSIDALAIGVTLALLDVDILVAAPTIGATTFVMTTIGLMAGRMIGDRVGHRAEGVAGIGLCLIGCFILYEHLLA